MRVAIGQPCSFYHEGGHGQNYWARGWRYGVVRAVPIKGQRKGWARIEVPVRLYEWDGKRWQLRAFERAWVRADNINAPGDTTYHGPVLQEVVAERAEKKAADIKAQGKGLDTSREPCSQGKRQRAVPVAAQPQLGDSQRTGRLRQSKPRGKAQPPQKPKAKGGVVKPKAQKIPARRKRQKKTG